MPNTNNPQWLGVGTANPPATTQILDAGRLLAVETLALDLINEERKARRFRAYVSDARLRAVAEAHSQDMAMRGYCSHFSPEGMGPVSRVSRRGIGHRALGENVALVSLPHEPHRLAELEAAIREAHAGFMNSLGHRRAILNAKLFTHAWVGVAVVGNHVGITQLFISPGRTSPSKLTMLLRLFRLASGGG